jgi:hypothetical protein
MPAVVRSPSVTDCREVAAYVDGDRGDALAGFA